MRGWVTLEGGLSSTLVLASLALGAALEYGLQIALGRFGGPEAVGVYAEGLAMAQILAMVLAAGVPSYALRRIPVWTARRAGGLMKRVVLRWILVIPVLGALVVVLGLVAARLMETPRTAVLVLALAIAVAQAWENGLRSFLRGLGDLAVSYVLSRIVRRALPLAFVLIVGGWTGAVSGDQGLALLLVGVLATVALMASRVRSFDIPHLPGHPLRSILRLLRGRPRVRGLLGRYLAVQTLSVAVLAIDLVILGWLLDDVGLGIYAVGSRIGLVVMLGLTAGNAVFAPRMASAWDAATDRDFRLATTRAARVGFALAVTLAVGVALLAPFFLSLYGEAFATGAMACRVIAFGAVMHAVFGPAVNALLFSGAERIAITCLAFGLLLTVAGVVVGAHLSGFEGGAWGLGVTLAAWNGAAAAAVRIRYGFWPSVWTSTARRA